MSATNPLVFRNRHKYLEPLSKMILSGSFQLNAPPHAPRHSSEHRAGPSLSAMNTLNARRMSRTPTANAYCANASPDMNTQGAEHNDQRLVQDYRAPVI